MKVGWIGLGKVGLPMALALAYRRECEVYGYDISPWASQVLGGHTSPPPEKGIGDLLGSHGEALASPAGARIALLDSVVSVAQRTNVIFVCVQTPHEPGLDGTKVGVEECQEFEYGYLITACSEVAAAAASIDDILTLVVVSTTLPGTMDRLVRPLLPTNVRLVYSPSFISLGSVIRDFLSPDFVLVGSDDRDLEDYAQLLDVVWPSEKRLSMSTTSAEMAKMANNVYQTLQITYANELAHLCSQTGADVGDVLDSINTRNRQRNAVARPGMPEGGPCRPRDLMAMAFLSQQLGNGTGRGPDVWYNRDLFNDLLDLRETHARRLAYTLAHWRKLTGLPITIIGRSYKADTPLYDGSPAHLVMAVLAQAGTPYDTYNNLDEDSLASSRHLTTLTLSEPAVYLVGAQHTAFLAPQWRWPPGSVVVDPWGFIPLTPRVIRVRPGWSKG